MVSSFLRLVAVASSVFAAVNAAFAVTLVEAGQARATVYLDAGSITPAAQADLTQVCHWLIDAVSQASGARLSLVTGAAPENAQALVLTTIQAYPELAEKAGLKRHDANAYAIVSTEQKSWLIGANPLALRYAAAHLLREWGFRFYAPSPRWHIVPERRDVRVDFDVKEAPGVASRSIWYAYGMPDKTSMDNYRRWVFANRLTADSLINPGHSYGNIIGRNAKEFEAHPEYYALLENGERDSMRPVNARKFCYSNAGLADLVARDRIKLLGELRKANPLEYMVSVEPSDGEGTCHCDNCRKLGSTTDRVFYLANDVARKLRAVHPEAWVGLYAYSSHRLPPGIELEPNVYVQVALAFNRTEYSLPELVDLWSKKAGAVGLREYYGVEAWDWGLPGRMRGGKVDYHRQWIPYYAQRKLTSINAETNANWAGQMPGLYVASEMMWKTDLDVDALVKRYFEDCYGPAATRMHGLYAQCEAGALLNPRSLAGMFGVVAAAHQQAPDARIRARLVDMMAYFLYVDNYRRFELVQNRQPARNDIYYQALKSLMTYTWQIRERDIVHYYALARRLTNGLPLQDGRPEIWLARKEAPPVWMAGEALTDEQIAAQFHERAKLLAEDKTPHVTYSRYLERVNPAGPNAGASRVLGSAEAGVGHFRQSVTGYLVPGGQRRVTIGIQAVKNPVTFKVFLRGEEILVSETVTTTDAFTPVGIDLPKAGEYRFAVQGEARLQVPPDVPLLYEASVTNPAWIDGSGPYYFYVPRGVRQIFVDGDPRFSFFIPGNPKRRDVTPADREPDQAWSVIDVPEGADGQVWRTDAQTRGRVILLNTPPLLSANRDLILIPREVAESDGLTTAR